MAGLTTHQILLATENHSVIQGFRPFDRRSGTQTGSLTMLGTLIGKHVDRLSKRLKADARVPVGAGR